MFDESKIRSLNTDDDISHHPVHVLISYEIIILIIALMYLSSIDPTKKSCETSQDSGLFSWLFYSFPFVAGFSVLA